MVVVKQIKLKPALTLKREIAAHFTRSVYLCDSYDSHNVHPYSAKQS
jgi:hypothetical protein